MPFNRSFRFQCFSCRLSLIVRSKQYVRTCMYVRHHRNNIQSRTSARITTSARIGREVHWGTELLYYFLKFFRVPQVLFFFWNGSS